MLSYTLNQNGSYASKIIDNEATPEWVNTTFDQAYLAWVAEGNTPNPYVAPPEPPPLTTEEKLAAAGITIDELKALLGL